MLNYTLLPENLRDGMRQYIEHGILPGSFLMACLENDFVGAVGLASPQRFEYLFAVASFLYNELPAQTYAESPWGSPDAVQRWMTTRRQEANR